MDTVLVTEEILKFMLALLVSVGVIFAQVMNKAKLSKMQVSIDELKTVIEKLTSEEIREKAIVEVFSNKPDLTREPHLSRDSPLEDYLDNEEAAILELSKEFEPDYLADSHVRIGTVEYDLVLKAKHPKEPDYLVEIKSSSSNLHEAKLLSDSLQHLRRYSVYREVTGRRADLILAYMIKGGMETADFNKARLTFQAILESKGISPDNFKLRIGEQPLHS